MDISKLDKNFKVDTKLELEDVEFHNIEEEPITIHGVLFDEGMYRRLPKSVAEKVSPGVAGVSKNVAGGRVRFVTDSPYIAVRVEYSEVCKMPLMAFTGTIGLDLYSGEKYYKTYIPDINIEDLYEGVIYPTDKGEREYTINFPIYSGIKKMYVGIKEGSSLKAPKEYEQPPIVYYGSSITQGGCASRPGCIYENIIARELEMDYINLGFAGNAKGEVEIAEYIAGLKMSVFVYDYDRNAPTVEHLENTHERMFKIIREKNPELPILMISRQQAYMDKVAEQTNAIVKKTYENALVAGDKNVYFLPGEELIPPEIRDIALVDNLHPTDVGFYYMAKGIGARLKEILKR